MKDKKQLSNAEIASFCSQVAMLFQAGITPAEGINIMLSDSKDESAKALLEQIRDVCRQGEPFNKALTATGMFPDYVLHTIALGEESGNLDVCIAIRMAVKKNGVVSVQAGGGIVADSVPENEYIESQNKAGAVISAIERAAEVEAD